MQADASDNVHEDAAPADETSQHAEDVEAAEGEAPHSPHLTLGENTTAAAAPPSPRHHEASLGSNTDDKPAQEDSNPHHLMPPAAPAEVVQQPPTAALDDPMGEQLDSSADGLAAARQRDSTGHDTAAGELAGHDTAALVLAGHGTAAAAPAEQATLAVFTDVRTGDETGQADTMSCTEPPHCKQQICAKGNISSTGHTPTHASAEKKVKGMRCRATATK